MYLGDPVNTIRIFNEKYVDEIVVLDIDAPRTGSEPDLKKLKELASECFMPLGFGGGINSVKMVASLLSIGVEKTVFNSACFRSPQVVTEAVKEFGGSTVVGAIDVSKSWFGKDSVYIDAGKTRIPDSPKSWARKLEDLGVGEIIVNSIDLDGEMAGYDLKLVSDIAQVVSVPVIALGGARDLNDFRQAVDAGAAASAAGAAFVFKGKHRAVLIQYPSEEEIVEAFQ